VTGPGFLEVRDVTAGYAETTVLRGVTIEVREGAIAALLGPNGAGKTTLLRIAAGLMRPTAGAILVGGEDCTRRAPHARAREGLCLIPEGRGVFPHLTVRENLLLQVPPGRDKAGVERGIDAFPVLGDRLGQRAATLSGGQQQMLALARCFVARPKLVLLDEVSMGLAPKIVEEIFEALAKLAAQGVSLLLVEQYVTKALEISDAVYLLNRGEITFSGSPSDLDEDAVMRGYLGIEEVSMAEKEE
jgi:branched-chain amino acid transport system ATP-binding protein